MIRRQQSEQSRQNSKLAGRTGAPFRLLAAALAVLSLLCLTSPGASAYDREEIAAVKMAVETFLENYTAEAMLYEDRSQATASVLDPETIQFWGDGQQTFPISGKDITLNELQKNIAFVEKKAYFYSNARQMQGIDRENLQAAYRYPAFEVADGVCRLSVTEIVTFRYTDSDRVSVYETPYRVTLIKLGGQWVVADITDGSRFDGLYKKEDDFDPSSALAELEANLHTEVCSITSPYDAGAAEGGKIYYSGANAAAYAYTYSRLAADTARGDFYNPQFKSYAGQGGDCMNFASQCLWAGFGGSQAEADITQSRLPMDTDGESRWYSSGALSDTEDTLSWISCQAFREYLTGKRDGTGAAGSNAASDVGMYASIIDVGAGSPVAGFPVELLKGAVAHVEGNGGDYAHAIVFTDAHGTSRDKIWFCCHTKDLTHIKLGDYYFGPIKVYIPHYIRQKEAPSLTILTDGLPPVQSASTAEVGFRVMGGLADLTLTITAPDGTADAPLSVQSANACAVPYTFAAAGLYRVDCRAVLPGSGNVVQAAYYIRCYGNTEGSAALPSTAVPETDADDSTPPGWLLS